MKNQENFYKISNYKHGKNRFKYPNSRLSELLYFKIIFFTVLNSCTFKTGKRKSTDHHAIRGSVMVQRVNR